MPKLAKQAEKKLATNEVPEPVKPYVFHGCDVSYIAGQEEAVGTCPFCGREGKFSVNVETGQWRCFVCSGDQESGGGGAYDFLEKLYKDSEAATQPSDYAALTAELGLSYSDTLVQWGLAKSVLTDDWLIPGWGLDHEGKLRLMQLYMYVQSGRRMVSMPTPGHKHQLIGLPLYDKNKPDNYICEGWKDGMRLWEVLRTTKVSSDGVYSLTASQDSCLLRPANVLATPSCTTFSDTWCRWFREKMVCLLYDNDYPRKHAKTGAELPPAGWSGMRLATGRLANAAASIFYLRWAEEGYDANLADGYDVRDSLKGDVLVQLPTLLNKIEPVPDNWIEDAEVAKSNTGDTIKCKPCSSWANLRNVWRKALMFTDGLDHALVSSLACCASTLSVGDQLWFKVIGPPSCGKSTIAEALTVAKDYVLAKSTIRGFHSGYRSTASEDGKEEDNSLIERLRGMTLATKDGDTLLQAPNLGQILSEARDLYDSVSRTHYRNQTSKDYEGIRWTWLLFGTSSLRILDDSELGARFLDCVLMDDINEAEEEDILWRVANKAASNVNIQSTDDATSHYSPELLSCMELTGGYVNWLRENANKILPTIEFPDESLRECTRIGKFVAYMRARPSKKQAEKAERELGARLVSQHVRYAKCIAFVLNCSTVNAEVMARTRRIGLDTARGVVLDITKTLYRNGSKGLEFNGIHLHNQAMDGPTLSKMLQFLVGIKVVEVFKLNNRVIYRLTKTVMSLYKSVVVDYA